MRVAPVAQAPGAVTYQQVVTREPRVLRSHVRRRRWIGPVAVVAAVLVASACTADPPPPIEQTEPTATPAPTQKRNTVVVAIDGVETGFNPHLLADQSPVGAAIAELVLPSAFRPVPNAEDPAFTEWVLDDSVLVSAEVVSQAPFTIEYEVRTDAQWSDSAPIAAEDFHYLWQQMTSQPGVVDAAGYRLIENVQSSGGGKTVTVTLRERIPRGENCSPRCFPHTSSRTPRVVSTPACRKRSPCREVRSRWSPSTVVVAKCCSSATTGSGASPPCPTRSSCDAVAATPSSPNRCVAATPRSHRYPADRLCSPSSVQYRTCALTCSSSPGRSN